MVSSFFTLLSNLTVVLFTNESICVQMMSSVDGELVSTVVATYIQLITQISIPPTWANIIGTGKLTLLLLKEN